ncbi:MAG: hypothetical protein ACFFE6_03585 [Candidatus Thorarchaeota archaeon]
MVISKPNTELPPESRKSAKYIYIAIYVVTSCFASVSLSLSGVVALDPFIALIAGIVAGFALAIVQITYVNFVVRTSWRIKGKPID